MIKYFPQQTGTNSEFSYFQNCTNYILHLINGNGDDFDEKLTIFLWYRY
jgi:hypothetical protein